MRVFIDSVALRGPGLPGWETSRMTLAGQVPYVPEPMPRPAGEMLPALERRRSSPTVRLAVQVAKEALDAAARDASGVATVFASASGDTEIIHHICAGLAEAEREISPMRFHNSVHNAPAGYWGIATGSRQPSTSLSAYDGSFAAGLLEAATQCHTEGLPVLLVAYDLPPPVPLYAARPIMDSFACALLLASDQDVGSLAGLDLHMAGEPLPSESRLDESSLEQLRLGNPAARALPLLTALAGGVGGPLHLPYLDDLSLILELTPCASTNPLSAS